MSIQCKDDGVGPRSGQDTTSHNFTWEIDTLGDGAGSILFDVKIVSTNPPLAYAAGQVSLLDSVGQWDPNPYNVLKWDGNKWNLERLEFPQYNVDCSIAFYSSALAKAVFSFDQNNVLFSDGLSVARLGGSVVFQYPCLSLSRISGRFLKMWGSSPDDFYCVGTQGTIFHFTNGSWQQLASGTSLDIHDIWGAQDPATGKFQILAVASNDLNKKFLRIDGNNVTAEPDSGLANELNGVWFVPNHKYYIVGAGIHYKSLLDNSVWNRYASGVVTSYASGGVRGSGVNDVFVVGSFNEVVHFNGASWYNYRNEIPFGDGALGGIAIKDNLMITVGLAGQKAIAIVGRR